MGARTAAQTLQPTAWGARARASRTARAKSLARPMGAVAVRLPERMSAQLTSFFPSSSPRMFVHEGARQALERRLLAASPGPVSLSITDNRHSIISHSWEKGGLRARVHHMFLDAPLSIQNALVRYVMLSDRDASVRIGHFIEENGGRLARRSRRIPLSTKGKHHDLLAIFHEINARYFDGAVNAFITWGKRAPRRPGAVRHSIKLGSYSATERLIRIHPALDRSWVPRYFVAYIVYHEMLHHVIPAKSTERQRKGGEGRRQLHPPEFREREAKFRHFERALRWEAEHIGRLLRS